MSDTIWAAIITSVSALLIIVIKGIFDLKKVRQTQYSVKDIVKSDDRPSAVFLTYIWQTQKIPIAVTVFLIGSLIYDFIEFPNPITSYFVFSIVFKFSILVSVESSIIIFYLIRLISGSLKEPNDK